MLRKLLIPAVLVAGLAIIAMTLNGKQLLADSATSFSLDVAPTGPTGRISEVSYMPGSTMHPVYGRLLDAQLRAVIAENGLTGDPSIGRDLPGIEDPMAQLGKKLFFTKALGGDTDSACASCHLPTLGGGDGLALSIGVGAIDPDLIGPGRAHPEGRPTVPRNAPTTFNIAMWDQVQFWDGRVESLGKAPLMEGNDGIGIRTPDVAFGEVDPTAGANLTIAQSRFPVTSPEEMRGFTFEAGGDNNAARDHLAARLGGVGIGQGELTINDWQNECAAVYPGMESDELVITYELVAEAIGTYERSQVFVDTPWKAYVEGEDGAISRSAKQGALLFYRSAEQGGAGCADCHGGDFFTDEEFYALAIPQIGNGKGDGVFGDDDYGRVRETGRPGDLYAFRTPTLLNVEVTGPYGHDGAYATLEGIIRHHLDPAGSVAAYDVTLLEPDIPIDHLDECTGAALVKLQQDMADGTSPLQPVHLAEQEIGSLVDFMLALTDPCVKSEECMAPWMPADFESDPDGLRLMARTLVDDN
jgi:cytochrome c peroxidase